MIPIRVVLFALMIMFVARSSAAIAGLQEDPTMTDFVYQMLRRTGLTKRIPVVVDPKTKWCAYATATPQGSRYIAVSPTCVGSLQSKEGIDWKSRAVLLHEIGHHLAGHILTRGHSHEDELEADYYSGWVNRHLGATLEEALAYFSRLDDRPTASHPGRAKRVAAVTRGWQDAALQQPPQKAPKFVKGTSKGWWQDLLQTPLPWAK